MANKKVISLVRDGWENILTGLGIKGKDKRLSADIVWERMMESDAEELYAASDIAGRVVDELPEDAFREGYEIKFKGDSELRQKIDAETERLGINEKCAKAWSWARMYGGAAIVFIPRNINDLMMPLNIQNINEVANLLVVSRWELPYRRIESDIRKPGFGLPVSYHIQPRSQGGISQAVHASRVIRFDGAPLPRQKFIENSYWNDSVLTKVKNHIMNYDASIDGVASTMQDFSVGLYKVKDLGAMLADGDDDLVVKRMQIVNLTKSIAKAIVVDTENEDFQYQTRTLTGVAETVGLIEKRLVASTNMPHTKVLGQSPSGLGATGESEQKEWYDFVARQQERYLKPRLRQILTVMFAAKAGPTAGQIPTDFTIEFKPLYQMSDTENAEIRNKQAQTDQIYIQTGVVDPVEVAISRFGSGKYSTETTLTEERTANADVPGNGGSSTEDPAKAPDKGATPGPLGAPVSKTPPKDASGSE